MPNRLKCCVMFIVIVIYKCVRCTLHVPQVVSGTHVEYTRIKGFTRQMWWVGSDGDRKKEAANHFTDLRMSEK